MKFNPQADIQCVLKKFKQSSLYYTSIFHCIHLAVVITNKKGHITAVNPAAQDMWDMFPKKSLGYPIQQMAFFSSFLQEKTDATLMTCNRNEITELSFDHSSGEKKYFNLDFVPLLNEQNKIVGIIMIGTDITSKKQLEKEKRILEGLLPICSHCKKIRDQDQQWIVLEQYIDDHSFAKFSHSICPECNKEHYSDI